jgi:hypothetical protein
MTDPCGHHYFIRSQYVPNPLFLPDWGTIVFPFPLELVSITFIATVMRLKFFEFTPHREHQRVNTTPSTPLYNATTS